LNATYQEFPLRPLTGDLQDLDLEKPFTLASSSSSRIIANTVKKSVKDEKSFEAEEIGVANVEGACSEIHDYQIFIVANPKSGTKKGAHILKRYGGIPRKIQMEAKCLVQVFDVTTQIQAIVEALKNAIISKIKA